MIAKAYHLEREYKDAPKFGSRLYCSALEPKSCRTLYCTPFNVGTFRFCSRGCAKKKNIPGVEFFYKDTPGWTTYLCNQARFYIGKYDDINGVGACRGCESCSIVSRQTVVHCTSKVIPLEKE